MGFDRNPMGFDRNPMGFDRNPMGFDRNPMGFDRNPMGFDRNPTGSERFLSDPMIKCPMNQYENTSYSAMLNIPEPVLLTEPIPSDSRNSVYQFNTIPEFPESLPINSI
ncbi:unnamed protein product [Rotaria magnacalcarata]|uniref:Uncharacterized protein n=1 Tax=Rotaria magnacalcarata TaxID=392030 RepID=A0A816FBL4_9BILA|nr:unnamed protein product [Rotaria magnacalcarata]CAF4147114.1 unnamed protein product [Rotaria magnacalcarata]CAF5053620.1 unnamed protein product [Rotaria magnacalcarata]